MSENPGPTPAVGLNELLGAVVAYVLKPANSNGYKGDTKKEDARVHDCSFVVVKHKAKFWPVKSEPTALFAANQIPGLCAETEKAYANSCPVPIIVLLMRSHVMAPNT